MTILEFQRQSIAYPPRIYLGTLQLISTPASLGNEILMFCKTVKKERPLIPDWGLPEIVHKKAASGGEIIALIKSNLIRYFQNVNFKVTLVSKSSNGELVVEIEYTSPRGYGTVQIVY